MPKINWYYESLSMNRQYMTGLGWPGSCPCQMQLEDKTTLEYAQMMNIKLVSMHSPQTNNILFWTVHQLHATVIVQQHNISKSTPVRLLDHDNHHRGQATYEGYLQLVDGAYGN